MINSSTHITPIYSWFTLSSLNSIDKLFRNWKMVKIYVGKLTSGVTNANLRSLFEPFGTVTDAERVRNRFGHGFWPFWKSVLRQTLKMATKWPQISWLFLFLYDLSEKQKDFLVFHSDFWCLDGGGGEHAPPLNVYFQPRPK